MRFIDYFKQLKAADSDGAALRAFAARVRRSPDYLYIVALGHRKASGELARLIDEASGGVVSRHELRPDVFGPGAHKVSQSLTQTNAEALAGNGTA